MDEELRKAFSKAADIAFKNHFGRTARLAKLIKKKSPDPTNQAYSW